MDERQTLKRRGILAAAGAVVAGIAAKQAAQPVGATHQQEDLGLEIENTAYNRTYLYYAGAALTGQDCIFTVSDKRGLPGLGPTAAIGGFSTLSPGVPSNVTTGVFGATTSGSGSGVFGQSFYGGTGVSGASISGTGVYGNSASGNGVYGSSSGDYAIEGNLLAPTGSGKAGVFGFGNGSGTFGVLGDGYGAGIAVQGQHGTIGVFGTVTAANAIGVQGSSTTGIGVYGTTSAAGQYGVLGQTLANNSFGLTGIANGSGCAAFAGATTNAASYAAYFQGHVQIEGAFDVIGAGNKHAVVPHPDGTHRTIYSVESPECWVEDFGEGTLAAGKAEVKLEADFAALVHTDHYHVFLTGIDDHHHLIAKAKSASGFTVEADAALAVLKGKKASDLTGTFSWRVVAKPKTNAKVERLAKATLAPKIDFTKLPQPPSPLPVAPTPPKKP